ncbi:MAG: hypothetical protein ACK4MV_00055 [Beijerinckiaceae bacterium]
MSSMITIRPARIILLAALALAAAGATFAEAQKLSKVEFVPGQSTATVRSQIRGHEYADFVLSASAGQTLAIEMKASNRSSYFNVTPPASENAMFNGSVSGEKFTRLAPSDGDYTVRVYLMRNAARRNESSSFALQFAMTGAALAPLPAAADATIKDTPFHASTQASCSLDSSPASQQCQAFVIRRGYDGTGTVEVVLPNGEKRRVLFVKGTPVSSDSARDMTSTRNEDLTTVTFDGGETFVIPDMLVNGG